MKIKKGRYVFLPIFLVGVLPVLLWFFAPSYTSRFDSFAHVSASIGQIFALVGTALFALNLILSTRLPLLEKKFDGLNNLYAVHSQIGQVAFMLLLFHPFFLIPKYTSGAHDTLAFLLFGNSFAQNMGAAALWLMLVLIILTLYLRPKYHIWKLTHKFFGVAFFLAALHAWIIPSDLSRYAPLKIYVFTLVGLGIVSFLYRAVFHTFLVKKYRYVVKAVISKNNMITEIVLEPKERKLPFKPGQFAFVRFHKSQVNAEAHPFSIISTPREKELRFAIKNLGDYTARVGELGAGTQAEIEGPYGTFSFADKTKSKSQIWIAGGIGITPFISMAKDLIQKIDYQIDLYYCVHSEAEAVYLHLLKDIEQRLNGRLRVVSFCSDERGFFSLNALKEISGSVHGKDILLCGPPPMIIALKKQFADAGIRSSKIHSEEFNF